MSCDHELANEKTRCSGKNASYITISTIKKTFFWHLLLKKMTGLSCSSERIGKERNAVHLKSHPENRFIETGNLSLRVCFKIFLTISAVVL